MMSTHLMHIETNAPTPGALADQIARATGVEPCAAFPGRDLRSGVRVRLDNDGRARLRAHLNSLGYKHAIVERVHELGNG
jgi:hypothetical protein